jgi:hypothetical protein
LSFLVPAAARASLILALAAAFIRGARIEPFLGSDNKRAQLIIIIIARVGAGLELLLGVGRAGPRVCTGPAHMSQMSRHRQAAPKSLPG